MEYIYKKLIKPIWVWGWENFGFGDSQDQPNEDVSRHFMNGWKDSNLKFQFNDESERSKVRRATQVIKIALGITNNFLNFYGDLNQLVNGGVFPSSVFFPCPLFSGLFLFV